MQIKLYDGLDMAVIECFEIFYVSRGQSEIVFKVLLGIIFSRSELIFKVV
jgi:hypothetical protein